MLKNSVLAKGCGLVSEAFTNKKALLRWERRILLGKTPLSGNVLGETKPLQENKSLEKKTLRGKPLGEELLFLLAVETQADVMFTFRAKAAVKRSKQHTLKASPLIRRQK